jgi:hypothetical protein
VRWAPDGSPPLGARIATGGAASGIVGVPAAPVPADFELLLGPGVSVRRKADDEGGAVGAVRAISGMSGGVSGRRRGFPEALRHDARILPDACGGPLLDLDGRAVGVNIAAHDLTCTLAIPASRVRALLAELLE